MKNTLFILTMLFVGLFAKAENFNATVYMKNGDIVSGTTNFTTFTVKSKYGTLQVPAKQISDITFGVATDYNQQKEVTTKLKQLQMASENEARSIYEQLLNKGNSIIGIVKDFTSSSDYDFSENMTYTVDGLLKELYEKSDMDYMTNTNDVINFDDINVIEGNIDFSNIIVKSDYGTLTINRNKIESLELLYIDNATGTNNYKVFANKNITGNYDDKNAWLNTGIVVKAGDQLLINATGKAKLESLSGGYYGPNGYVGGTEDDAYSDEDEIPYGTLVYKIGEGGEMLKAGSNFNNKVEENGTVFIAIYETVYDKKNTGGYTVKIIKK